MKIEHRKKIKKSEFEENVENKHADAVSVDAVSSNQITELSNRENEPGEMRASADVDSGPKGGAHMDNGPEPGGGSDTSSRGEHVRAEADGNVENQKSAESKRRDAEPAEKEEHEDEKEIVEGSGNGEQPVQIVEDKSLPENEILTEKAVQRHSKGEYAMVGGTGLVNGNGLVNGKGLVNGTGLTNGLSMVNGKYVDMRNLMKHGYVNGEKLKVGGASSLFGFHKRRKIKGISSRRRVMGLAMVVILIIIVFLPVITYYAYPTAGIKIDGNFSDWANQKPVVVEGDMIYLHLSGLHPTQNSYYYEVLAPGTSSPVHISNLSSYNFRKGDILIAFAGNGEPRSAVYRVYQGGNPRSPSSWGPPIDLRYALAGSQAELALYRPPGFSLAGGVFGFGFERGAAAELVTPPVSSWSYSSLVVSEQWTAPGVITNDTMLMFLKLCAYGGDVRVNSITFKQPSYADTPATLSMGVAGTYYVKNRTYVFTKPLDVPAGSEKVLLVHGHFAQFAGTTVYFSVSSLNVNAPYTVRFTPVKVSYVGPPPATPRVDGGFNEWKIKYKDASNDTLSPQGLNTSLIASYSADSDITGFGRLVGQSTYYYVSVSGTILHGTYVGRKDGLMQIKSTTAPTGSPKPTAAVGNDQDVVYIGIDEDNDTATGYRWMGIGADYLVEIRGRLQDVQSATLERWDGKWVPTDDRVNVAISNHGLELSLPGRFTGRYVVYVDNWLGVWDTASLLDKSTRATVTDHVVLNEIYIGTDGYMQWVELCNPTTAAVDLSGWEIVVSNGLTGTVEYKYATGTSIAAGNGFNVDANTLDVDVDGKIVVLLDSSGNVIDSITMPTDSSTYTDQSYGRYSDSATGDPTTDWAWMTPTYDAQNPVEVPEFSISNILIIVILIGGMYAVTGKRKEKK